MSKHLPNCSIFHGDDCCDCYPERIASLERQLEECRGLLAAFKDAYSPEDDCYNTIATHREDGG